jgi:hypothetical protein
MLVGLGKKGLCCVCEYFVSFLFRLVCDTGKNRTAMKFQVTDTNILGIVYHLWLKIPQSF